MIGRAFLFGGLCAASAAGLAIGWLWPEGMSSSAAAFLDVVRNLGDTGMLIFALAQTVIAMTGLVPAALLGVVAGAIYGLTTGFVLVAASTMIGSLLGFLIARSTLRGFVEPILARHPAFTHGDGFVARDGWRSVCLLRVSPVMPFAVTSYVLGLSSIGVRDYVVGTLASLPSLLAYVFLGTLPDAGLSTSSRFTPLHWALLAAGAAATSLFLVRVGRAYRPASLGVDKN